MQSLINKLFNGNGTAECEKVIDSALYERKTKLDKAEKGEMQLLNSFNEEQKKLFEDWKFLAEGIWCEEVDLAYERGFKTGALLMVEIHDVKF